MHVINTFSFKSVQEVVTFTGIYTVHSQSFLNALRGNSDFKALGKLSIVPCLPTSGNIAETKFAS